MKIAAITVTQNDGFKFKEWVEYYQEYKDELFMHIIVDNNSEEKYFELVKKTFVDSIIIRRPINGGATGAYNDGIQRALENSAVDSILLIGNDVRIKKGSTTILHEYLFSNPAFGMVSPILFKKDSDIVECYGCDLTYLQFMKTLNAGDHIKDIKDEDRIVTLLPGGMNLSTRKFYETVGLQDDKLFLYWDEFDIYCRAKKAGFKMAATKRALAWHQHINPNNLSRRPLYVPLLGARNYVYLMKKHYSVSKCLWFLMLYAGSLSVNSIRTIRDQRSRVHYKYSFLGFFRGLSNNMSNDFLY